METIKLTVDSRKRISLTKLLPEGRVSSVRAYKEDNKIILEPMVEIPARRIYGNQPETSFFEHTRIYPVRKPRHLWRG